MTTYAAIDQFYLEQNQENMTARYDPNAPIDILIAQIADGVAYAELGEAPFTSKQIVDIALLCLAKTGVFNDDLKEWNRFPLLDRNWPKFRVHFFQSAPPVEGEATPHRGTALPKGKCSRRHECTKPSI